MFTVAQRVSFYTPTGSSKKGTIVSHHERLDGDYYLIMDDNGKEYQSVPDFVITGAKHRGTYNAELDTMAGEFINEPSTAKHAGAHDLIEYI